MNIQSAIKKGTTILKSSYIKTAELDTEILMAKVLDSNREYVILNNHKNDQQKILELLGEFLHALEIYGLEVRIEELESKFSKDLSETTFNEINDLKEEKKRKNIN